MSNVEKKILHSTTGHKRQCNTVHVNACWIRSKVTNTVLEYVVDCVWNVMAHALKPDFLFQRNGRVHLNRCGSHFSRLLAAEVCASAVVMLDIPCSEVVWRVLATHSFRQFPLHFPSRASPCAITFQLECTYCFALCKNGRYKAPQYYVTVLCLSSCFLDILWWWLL